MAGRAEAQENLSMISVQMMPSIVHGEKMTSDTKWKEAGHFTTIEGHTKLFFRGVTREQHGVAI